MKRIVALLLLFLLLSGCADTAGDMDSVLSLREKLLSGVCGFDAEVTADYGDKTYTFAMGCTLDAHGNLSFTVKEPESIAGISGTISKGEGNLYFDSTALAFELLADGQFSPVSAPWVLGTALRSGYITAVGKDGQQTRVTIRDSYAEDALTVDVWLDEKAIPVRAEILWDGRRILTLAVANFVIA